MKLDCNACPNCGGSRLESVETCSVHYEVKLREDGEWDYTGESRVFDEGSENEAPPGFFELWCRDCDNQWTAKVGK